MSLSRDTADLVARHLVAAGQIIDEDSELALQHAIAARRMASRIAVVREAVGLAAYAVGDWTTAIAELRTYHRMTGRQTHLAELADCERALGRPERAIDLFRGADKDTLDKAGAIELLIVAAGARGDLGQHDAAVAMLQVRELTADEDAEWAVRLRYAYADALLAAGRRDEAREWFARAAAADEDNLTDAAERLLELDGVTIEGDDPEDEPDEDAPTTAVAEATDEDDEDEDESAEDQDDDGAVPVEAAEALVRAEDGADLAEAGTADPVVPAPAGAGTADAVVPAHAGAGTADAVVPAEVGEALVRAEDGADPAAVDPADAEAGQADEKTGEGVAKGDQEPGA
ncbi:Replicase polyprotein 1ab [Actinoplanes nipponensis]|uniref:Replicase polyprotein 1ab n=1 Tax=Actinoplanes nipponensis TaxID=135950 RepID=UPI001EF38C17|nr:Replicase polyprotein 1ab [Actinoplanes nipponensis]